jgi:response regulator of citrate/malate metabolism
LECGNLSPLFCPNGSPSKAPIPARRDRRPNKSENAVGVATDASGNVLVTLRYFGGMTIEQASELLNISRVTAHRYWTYARAWLHQQITGGDGSA